MRELTLALATILRDRARDGVIDAAAEHAKVRSADQRRRLTRELRHDLEDVAIAMHDLSDREATALQIVPVKSRPIGDSFARVGCARGAEAVYCGDGCQCIHDLHQEQRHSIAQGRRDGGLGSPLPRATPRAVDDLLPIRNDQLLQHGTSPWDGAPRYRAPQAQSVPRPEIGGRHRRVAACRRVSVRCSPLPARRQRFHALRDAAIRANQPALAVVMMQRKR
jgi:hypothetical protein